MNTALRTRRTAVNRMQCGRLGRVMRSGIRLQSSLTPLSLLGFRCTRGHYRCLTFVRTDNVLVLEGFRE
jgi:hypothetical protein